MSKESMKGLVSSILLILLCGLGAYAMADKNLIAGRWDCVSTDERGTDVTWTLAVKSEAGKLSGSMFFGDQGREFEILEPVLNGDTFSFKIRLNPEETVELTARINGMKLDGAFKGKSSGTGTFKGARQ